MPLAARLEPSDAFEKVERGRPAAQGVLSERLFDREEIPDMSDNPFDAFLDLTEAAHILGCHPGSLRRLIKQGVIPATLFAGKYLLAVADVNAYHALRPDIAPGRPARKPEPPVTWPDIRAHVIEEVQEACAMGLIKDAALGRIVEALP